jgi:hypothetical protein
MMSRFSGFAIREHYLALLFFSVLKSLSENCLTCVPIPDADYSPIRSVTALYSTLSGTGFSKT